MIDAIGQGRRPSLDDPKQKAVFDAAVELHRDRGLSDATHDAALAALGRQGLVDLVGVCGYYTLISMTINAFEIPDGEGPALPKLDTPPEAMFRG